VPRCNLHVNVIGRHITVVQVHHSPETLPNYVTCHNYIPLFRSQIHPAAKQFCLANNLDHKSRLNNKYECTIDQELADAAAQSPGRRYACTQQMAALFCVKLRHGRHLEIMTSYQKSVSVNRCVFIVEEHSCQISSRSDLKRRSLAIFNRSLRQNNKNKMSSDVGSTS